MGKVNKWSRGVYRLLYNSKKEVAKKFRKWASYKVKFLIMYNFIKNETVLNCCITSVSKGVF